MKSEPARQQPVLVSMGLVDDPSRERVLLDRSVLDASGETTIDWYVPSPDGKKIAISLSRGGTESGDVHVFEVASMKPIGESIRRVQGGTAGGSLAWNRDGLGFLGTPATRARGSAPRPTSRSSSRSGSTASRQWPEATDRKELGDELPRIASITLRAKRDGEVGARGGEERRRRRGGALAPAGRKGNVEAPLPLLRPGRGGRVREGPDLYVLSRKGAPRDRSGASRSRPGEPIRSPRPACSFPREATRFRVVAARDRLYVTETAGGPSVAAAHGGADREADGRRFHPARLHGGTGHAPGQARHPLPERELGGPGRLVRLRPGDGKGGEDEARDRLARGPRRSRGGPGVGHLPGRHPGPRRRHPDEGDQARRNIARRSSTGTAVTDTTRPPPSRRCGRSGC